MALVGLSLFSGMGGDTLAMEQFGCSVIAYNEFDKYARESHSLNFPNCKAILDPNWKKEKDQSNIQLIDPKIFEEYSGKVDIIFGGFSCQGFSVAGKKLPSDPRNTLFRDFARVTNIIKPKYVIGENVDGLLKMKTETGEKFIDIIVSEFEKIGYSVKYKVCRAEEYSVPQLRKRLIIVGTRKDLKMEYSFPIDKSEIMSLEGIIKFNMTGAIRVLPEDFDMTSLPEECILRDLSNDEDENNVHPYLRLKVKTRDSEYSGKTYSTLVSFSKRISPIHSEIIDIRKPSKTIICTYDHQPRLLVPLQNKNGYYLRTILPDELKQIQGFPKDFKLTGPKKEQIKQIGNAVPPPLVKKILKSIN